MQAKWAIPIMSIIGILRRSYHSQWVTPGHSGLLAWPGPHLTSGKLPRRGFLHFLFSLPGTLFPRCLPDPSSAPQVCSHVRFLIGSLLTILFKTTTLPTPRSLSFPAEFFSIAPSTSWHVFSHLFAYFLSSPLECKVSKAGFLVTLSYALSPDTRIVPVTQQRFSTYLLNEW